MAVRLRGRPVLRRPHGRRDQGGEHHHGGCGGPRRGDGRAPADDCRRGGLPRTRGRRARRAAAGEEPRQGPAGRDPQGPRCPARACGRPADRRPVPAPQARAGRHGLRRPDGAAARLATRFDDIGAIERQRFRAVLLDEFQDTSEAQLELLRALFVSPGSPYRSPLWATPTSRSTGGAVPARRRSAAFPGPSARTPTRSSCPCRRAGATTARSWPWPTTSPRRCGTPRGCRSRSSARHRPPGPAVSRPHACTPSRTRPPTWRSGSASAALRGRRPRPSCAANGRSSRRSSRRSRGAGSPTRSWASAACSSRRRSRTSSRCSTSSRTRPGATSSCGS